MEEVKNVVSVTLTREDFQNLFEPVLESINNKTELSETAKFGMILSTAAVFAELENILFKN